MQRLEERTAKFVLKNLRHHPEFAWCQRMLNRLQLPPTVHHHAHRRVWQRRFYDFNVWSDRKIGQKLDCMHNNPAPSGSAYASLRDASDRKHLDMFLRLLR